eukprot:2709539-Rhodomonas_salina.1
MAEIRVRLWLVRAGGACGRGSETVAPVYANHRRLPRVLRCTYLIRACCNTPMFPNPSRFASVIEVAVYAFEIAPPTGLENVISVGVLLGQECEPTLSCSKVSDLCAHSSG